MRRFSGFGVLVLSIVVASAPNVFADSYTYTTTGCFLGGTCASDGSSSANFNNIFTGQTDATLSFDNVSSPTTTSSGTSLSLGSFDFSLFNPGISVYLGLFTLDVDFTDPAGTTGDPFVALVTGDVLINAGGATITLFPGSQIFNYPGGSFALDLGTDPIRVSSGNSSAVLDASIVTVPEGSGWAMLGMSGLILFGAFFKKFGHSADQQRLLIGLK